MSNQDVSLFCDATGVPQPVISWLYDGKIVFNSSRAEVDWRRQILKGLGFQVYPDGTLLLRGIQTHDQGRYSCKAENSVGKAEADTFLEVTGS